VTAQSEAAQSEGARSEPGPPAAAAAPPAVERAQAQPTPPSANEPRLAAPEPPASARFSPGQPPEVEPSASEIGEREERREPAPLGAREPGAERPSDG